MTMVGRFSECLLLAYRTPAESVRRLLPAGLELITVGAWAFWNIVLCRIEQMRPRGVPAALGLSYHHVAYRLYVRSQTARGPLEGLYFVRSDADSRLISCAGNLLTDFRFHPGSIDLNATTDRIAASVRSNDRAADLSLVTEPATTENLAPGSPFATADQAAHALKYQPLALSVTGERLRMAQVRRDETHWRESPIRVIESRFTFFDRLNQRPALERATRVEPIDYEWRLGDSLALATSAPA
jgi:uncharacterized protein YqjF (DUF2071 family)